MSVRSPSWVPYLQVTPLLLVFLVFLVVPILTIVVVSFFDYDTTRLLPDFIFTNYEELLLSPVTWQTYLQTLQFSLITWALTLLIGFAIAYYLAFYVRSPTWQTVLFLVCTIPFWTSNIIRMISWIPFLGRNGLMNSALLHLGVIMSNQLAYLQYPAAAANAVVLLAVVLLLVAAIMRVVDIRKEL